MFVDHAHCEMKASSSAITYIYRYPYKYDLVNRMSKKQTRITYFKIFYRCFDNRILYYACSCERKIAPFLGDELQKFYNSPIRI
nr:tRNA isopentenyl-2-thiomethyl-A-37 hydroxylase MiaE [Francisella persica]